MANGWKVFAVTLMFIVILETAFIIWAMKIGLEELDAENQDIIEENYCIVTVCENYEAYYYSTFDNVCSCYQDGEVVHEEVVTYTNPEESLYD